MIKQFISWTAEAAGDLETAKDLQLTLHEEALVNEANSHPLIAANTERFRRCATLIGQGLCPFYCYNPEETSIATQRLDSGLSQA